MPLRHQDPPLQLTWPLKTGAKRAGDRGQMTLHGEFELRGQLGLQAGRGTDPAGGQVLIGMDAGFAADGGAATPLRLGPASGEIGLQVGAAAAGRLRFARPLPGTQLAALAIARSLALPSPLDPHEVAARLAGGSLQLDLEGSLKLALSRLSAAVSRTSAPD